MRQLLSLDRPLRGIRVSRPVVGETGAVTQPTLLGLRDQMRQEEAVRARLAVVCDELSAAVSQILPMVDCNLNGVAEIATELGLAIAREVVGEVVDAGQFDLSPMIVSCLRDAVETGGGAGERPVVRVELAPEDLNMVLSRISDDPELRGLASKAEFVADPGLERGSAVVTSNGGRMLYDPDEVLTRIAAEVRKSVGQTLQGNFA